MTTDMHPTWLAVGRRVQVARWFGTGGFDHAREATVVRHTKTQVILANGARFHEVRGRYEETPKYLDYTSILEPIVGLGVSP